MRSQASAAADGINCRRRLLVSGLLCWPFAATAQNAEVRVLTLRHTHTDERLSTTYFANGSYVPEAIEDIERLLRDFRTNEVHAIDLRLLDLLYALARECGGEAFEVISGYRSAATNAHLQATTEGVATNSLHLEGRAIDVRLTGIDTAKLRNAAMNLSRGGVGFYPQSDFVHLDTGRARSWG